MYLWKQQFTYDNITSKYIQKSSYRYVCKDIDIFTYPRMVIELSL